MAPASIFFVLTGANSAYYSPAMITGFGSSRFPTAWPRVSTLLAAALLLLSASAALAAGAPTNEPLKVVVVIGGHAFEPSFFSVFEGRPEFETVVHPHPMAFRPKLTGFDVIVLYDMLDSLEPPKQKRLQEFLAAGKGLVVLHHALINYGSWTWWQEEVSGGRYIRKGEELPPSEFEHDLNMHIRSVAEHPITQGLGSFEIIDEAYKGMWFSPRIKVLLETDHPAADRPVAWIGPHEKSRVAVIQLGHGREAHENPNYKRLVHNAILWAAGRLQ